MRQGELRIAHLGMQSHESRVCCLIERVGLEDALVDGNCVMKFSPFLMQPGLAGQYREVARAKALAPGCGPLLIWIVR